MRPTPRLILFACLVLASPLVAWGQTTKADDDDEVERVSVHLVSVPVSVTDRDGRFVADLGEKDFRITENGVAQTISNFATTEQPFYVLLLIDTSGSTELRLRDIQDSAIAFVNQLRPQDRVLPVAFDNDATALVGEWTGDREKLAAAIRGARTGMSQEKAETEVVKGRDGSPMTMRKINTRLYDAVHKASAVLRGVAGRKAMILFTDGFDTASAVATRKGTLAEAEELDALIYVVQYDRYTKGSDPASRAGATIPSTVVSAPRPIARNNTVDVRSSGGHTQVVSTQPLGSSGPPIAPPPVRPFERRYPKVLEAEKYLQGLAEKTGGRFFYADNMERIGLSFAAIADELRRMYSIGYHPTPLARPGERREVKIRVGRERVSVRARKAYVFKPR